MKDWSTTKKILVVIGVLILLSLVFVGVKNYRKSSKEAEAKRIANRIAQEMEARKSAEDVTGDELVAAIRSNLSKQPVSEISAKFYKQ